MRIRTVKPEFFLHEGLFEAEREFKLPLRLAYAGLWCAADREGRFKWEPRRLGVQIMPYDNIDFSRVLDALTTRGFIQRYACGTCEFGVIPSFKHHQVINNRERESDLPEPPEKPQIEGTDACPTRAPRVDDESAGLKSGREGKGKEGKVPSAEGGEVDEPKPKPDPRHTELIRSYCEAYEERTGMKYTFQPRDAKTLQVFLKANQEPTEKIIKILRWAWSQYEEGGQFAKSYFQCATIHDLCSSWPKIVMAGS